MTTGTGLSFEQAYYVLACVVELVESKPLDASRLAELRKLLGTGGTATRALRAVAEERDRLRKQLAGVFDG